MTSHTFALAKTLVLWLATLLAPYAVMAEEPAVPEVNDFLGLRTEMQEKKLPLLLAFRADYCGYCAQLEREYLNPMVQSDKYTNRILIRRFSLGKEETITDFNGKPINADDFANRYHAYITPTLVFLDTQGKEVAEHLLGYNNPDFYGAYLESAIETAHQAVINEK